MSSDSLIIIIPIAVVVLFFGGLGILCWLGWRERQPIGYTSHPSIGEITVFRDSWKSTAPVVQTTLGTIEISGGGRSPTDRQLELMQAIFDRHEVLIAKALDALADDLKIAEPTLERTDLTLTTLSLDDDQSFSFYFSALDRNAQIDLQAQLGLDFYVDFQDFDVTEAGFVH